MSENPPTGSGPTDERELPGATSPGIPALPLGVPPTPAPRVARGPRWLMGILGGAVILVVAVAGLIAAESGALNLFPAPSSSPSGEHQGARPLPATVPTPVPVAPLPAGVGVPIPTACDPLYSADFHATLTAAHPANAAAAATYAPTSDQTLQPFLTAPGALRCAWGDPEKDGLITVVAPVGTAGQKTVGARLRDIGAKCYAEFSGTRCVRSQSVAGIGTRGESHVLRDGVWIATYWTNFSPKDYTAEIVDAVFPA